MTKSELFPPIGCGRKYLITLNGDPFAGFDDYEHAMRVLAMYRDQPRAPNNAGKYRWELKIR